MKISSKGRYAVRVLCEIVQSDQPFISATEIAEKQNISIKYLERILNILLKANLIESQMGATGGYKLSKSPAHYSIAEILTATGDIIELAPCQVSGYKCQQIDKCPTCDYWQNLANIIYKELNKVSLNDILHKKY
ncbi:MAG: Rrf2 family transcriptional regulator [Clostridia bacterium]|nr:Rrf2 family transcriptional regulator [Clostridia bacterium]